MVTFPSVMSHTTGLDQREDLHVTEAVGWMTVKLYVYLIYMCTSDCAVTPHGQSILQFSFNANSGCDYGATCRHNSASGRSHWHKYKQKMEDRSKDGQIIIIIITLLIDNNMVYGVFFD